MDDNRIKLNVMGISYSPMPNGAFALLLAVDGDSPVRIPVVIGPAEAQSIAVFIERISVPRPMTHDLFSAFSHAFGIRLIEVFIYKFEDGIYSAEMTFADNDRQIVLDARTSDAIAIAMRAHAPIYTTPEIVAECGIELQEVDSDDSDNAADEILSALGNETTEDEDEPSATDTDAADPSAYPVDRLERMLARYIESEQYEQAAEIKAIIAAKGAHDKKPDDSSDAADSGATGNKAAGNGIDDK